MGGIVRLGSMTPPPTTAIQRLNAGVSFCVLCARVLFAIAFALAAARPAVAADSGATKSYNIPAGQAISTLKQFSAQSGLQIIFPESAVAGEETRAVTGRLTATAAISRMLAGTGLTFVRDQESGSFAVTRRSTAAAKEPNATPPVPSPAEVTSIPDTRQEEAIELSPFIVKPEAGWVATQTLSGTRLRTDLRDVGNEIEVFTRDFMDDLGLNNVKDALIYSANAENNDEYMASDPESSSFYTNSGGRVRGIGAGTMSTNMFETRILSDNYNLDSSSLVSGPNATLFGLGSPSGTFDANPSQAQFRNRVQTRLQYSSEESKRATLDVNHVLIPKILAVRVMGLWKEEQRSRKPNHDDDQRLTGAFTFRPHKHTHVRIRLEKVESDLNLPPRTAPYDRASLWVRADQVPGSPYRSARPGYDNRTAIPANVSNTTRIFEANTNSATLIANTPSAAVMGWGQSVRVLNPSAPTAYGVPNTEYDSSFQKTFLDGSIVPLDINPFGELKTTLMGGKVRTASLEQKLAHNLFLEFAVNREDSYMDIWGARGNNLAAVQADANMYLPVLLPGQTSYVANPNFGKYYVEYSPLPQPASYTHKDWRATLSYELDLQGNHTGWRRWLGRHRFAGVRSRNEATSLTQSNMLPRILDDPFIPGRPLTARTAANWGVNASRSLVIRSYLDDSFHPTSVGALDQAYKYVDGNGQTFFTTSGSDSGLVAPSGKRLSTSNISLSGSKTRVDTLLFAWQGRFLPDRQGNSRLILTYGYREDEVRSAIPDLASRTIDGGAGRPGFYPIYSDATWDPFGPGETGLTRNTGVVLRPAPWLDLYYNASSTFEVSSGRFSPFGTSYPGAEGDGKDYGIRLDLWQGKLALRVNRYENVLGPARASNTINQFRVNFNTLETRVRNLDPSLSAPDNWYAAAVNLGNNNYNIHSDRTSEGYEVSLDFRPMPNWNIRLNGAKLKAVESNIGTDWIEWVGTRLPVWQSVVARNGEIDAAGRPVSWLTADIAPGNDSENRTLKQFYEQQIVGNVIAYMQAADGRATDGARGKRANLISNFRFTEGGLKGLSLGGAVRWRPPPTIGYGLKVNDAGATLLDISKPYRGKTEMPVDLSLGYRGRTSFLRGFGYIIQLNIRNALNQDDPIPFTAFSNGEIARIATVEPRLFILSVGFDL